MVNEDSTQDQVEAYLSALAREKEGYLVRLSAIEAGKPERLDAETLSARVKAVEAEVRRAKKLLGK